MLHVVVTITCIDPADLSGVITVHSHKRVWFDSEVFKRTLQLTSRIAYVPVARVWNYVLTFAHSLHH